MKKILTAVLTLSCATAIFAGGIDNKSNLSTGYLRNPSRATETKRPEAVLYNIGGTSFMEDGLAFTIGNQFIFKEYTNELNSTEYKENKTVRFFPEVEAVYKKDRWAAFGGFGVFAGGGSLDYKDGTAATFLALYGATSSPAIAKNHSLEAYSATMGEILGFSYNITENISFAAAGRFLHASSNMKLTAPGIASFSGRDSIEYEASGYGFGGIFGVNAKDLIPGLTLSIQYQTITKLKIEFDTVKGKMASAFGVTEGNKYKNDLPAVLTLGAGYSLFDSLDLSLSCNYYFNKQATMQNPLGGSDLEYNDSWEIALGCDWQINGQIGVSAGAMYTKQGAKSDVNSAFSPVLDSIVTGCGIEYRFAKQVMATAAYMHCFYNSKDYEYFNNTIELGKNIDMVSIGITVKPF